MNVSYKRLWKLIIDKDMTNVQVRKAAIISPATFTKLKKNETVSMDVFLKLCSVLECNFEDVVEIVREESESLDG